MRSWSPEETEKPIDTLVISGKNHTGDVVEIRNTT